MDTIKTSDNPRICQTPIWRVDTEGCIETEDVVAAEEPLEIVLAFGLMQSYYAKCLLKYDDYVKMKIHFDVIIVLSCFAKALHLQIII